MKIKGCELYESKFFKMVKTLNLENIIEESLKVTRGLNAPCFLCFGEILGKYFKKIYKK